MKRLFCNHVIVIIIEVKTLAVIQSAVVDLNAEYRQVTPVTLWVTATEVVSVGSVVE